MRTASMIAPGAMLLLFDAAALGLLGSGPLGLPIGSAAAQDGAGRAAAAPEAVRSGRMGQPVRLGVDAAREPGLRLLRISGVPEGFRFSHGFGLRDGSVWYVAAPDVAGLELVPPGQFAGVIRFQVEFLSMGSAGQTHAAKRQDFVLQIEADPAPDDQRTRTAAVTGTQPQPAARPARPYVEEAAALARAQQLLERGDVTAARLLYEDLALAGSAQGALALARSFDPDFLRSVGAIGTQPDLVLARKWYEKAAELGNREASHRLSELRR